MNMRLNVSVWTVVTGTEKLVCHCIIILFTEGFDIILNFQAAILSRTWQLMTSAKRLP